MLRAYIAFLALAFVLQGCETPYNANLGSATIQVTVDASVSNLSTTQTVTLTQSQGYTDNSAPRAVTGAIVLITDDGGQAAILSEQRPGVYVTNSLQGIVGRTYTLSITTSDSKVFTAQERMADVPPVDSLKYAFKQRRGPNPASNYITFYFKDPANEVNFYRGKLLGNPKVSNLKIADWIVLRDRFANGNIISVDLDEEPYQVNVGDTITFQLWSLSETQYNFYNDIVQEANSAGNIFSAAARNPRGNIIGGAFGVFNVSAVKSSSIVIR